MRKLLIIGIALGAAALASAPAAALTAAEKCEAGKLQTAGKYAFCRMKAEAKAVKTGQPPDYTKCNDKYGPKWTAIEAAAGGACPVSGDLAAIQTQANSCTDGLSSSIAGDPPEGCAAAELCGNGAIDAGEDCDLGTLNGATCVSESFAGGALSCGDGCVFDTSGCFNARFVDNADGTISDNQTGLEWEKKTELDFAANFANPHDADNYFPWSGICTVNTSKFCQPTSAAATLCAANAEGGTTGCDECTGGDGTCNQATTVWTWAADLNAASFAGHGDWRVPTLQELQGILDFTDATPPIVNVAFEGPSCGVACTDITSAACSCTQSNYYWSATTYAPVPQAAWIVVFGDGGQFASGRTNDFYVRAVRTGS